MPMTKSIAYRFIFEFSVVAVIGKSVKLDDILLCSFTVLLIPSVESCTFENDVSSHFKEIVELLDYCSVHFLIVGGRIC